MHSQQRNVFRYAGGRHEIRCTESRDSDLVSFAGLRGCPQVFVCARGALAAVHINKSYSVDVGAISAVPEEAGG